MRPGHRVRTVAARGRAAAKLPGAAALPAAERLVRFAPIPNDVPRAPHLLTGRRIDPNGVRRARGGLGSGNVVPLDGLRLGGRGRRVCGARRTARLATRGRERGAGRRALACAGGRRVVGMRRSGRARPGTARERRRAAVERRGLFGRGPHARVREPVRRQQRHGAGQNRAGEDEDGDLQWQLRRTERLPPLRFPAGIWSADGARARPCTARRLTATPPQ